MIIDTPSIFGDWTPVEPVDLSNGPAVIVADVKRLADERRVRAEQQIAEVRAVLDGDADTPARAAERDALMAEHVRRFPWL